MLYCSISKRYIFDSAPHRPLVSKIGKLGLVHNYLPDRKQGVVVNGTSSPLTNTAPQVHQSSILGLLYSLSTSHESTCQTVPRWFCSPISTSTDLNHLKRDVDSLQFSLGTEMYLSLVCPHLESLLQFGLPICLRTLLSLRKSRYLPIECVLDFGTLSEYPEQAPASNPSITHVARELVLSLQDCPCPTPWASIFPVYNVVVPRNALPHNHHSYLLNTHIPNSVSHWNKLPDYVISSHSLQPKFMALDCIVFDF